MDGVLANFTSAALRNVKKKWNIDITYEEMLEPRLSEMILNHLPESKMSGRDIYKHIAPKGFFEDLDPYPGAIDALKELSKIHEVTIVTKPLEWENCPGEKYSWLKKHLGYHPKIVLVSSMEIKGMIDVDVMIDDDPRVIKNLSTAMPIVVQHPWNREFLKFEAVHSVGNFSQVPALLSRVAPLLFNPTY